MQKRLKSYLLVVAVALVTVSSRATAQNYLGTAQQFGVLGARTVTNTNATTIRGDLGVYSGTSITGQTSITLAGTVHQTDGVAQTAQANALSGFNLLAGLPYTTDLSGFDLGGRTLTPGVYYFSSSAQLTGTLVLDFLGNQNAAFVFRIGSALTTASTSTVSVLNGGAQSGVYWRVGTSATLGTNSLFAGNLIADQSITVTSGASILCGRAIALHAAVTLDNNVISNDCVGEGSYGTARSDFGSRGFSGGTGVGPTVVPEPSTFALLAGVGSLMALGLALQRRRLRV